MSFITQDGHLILGAMVPSTLAPGYHAGEHVSQEHGSYRSTTPRYPRSPTYRTSFDTSTLTARHVAHCFSRTQISPMVNRGRVYPSIDATNSRRQQSICLATDGPYTRTSTRTWYAGPILHLCRYPRREAASEPEKKTILMGHKISSFYAPLVRSSRTFFILIKSNFYKPY